MNIRMDRRPGTRRFTAGSSVVGRALRRIGRVGDAARVVLLVPLLVVPSAVMSQEPATKLPYGLSCSQCMIDARSTCAALPKAELVIDARQLEPVDERQECEVERSLDATGAKTLDAAAARTFEASTTNTPDVASARTCHVSAGSRFGGVFVLRSPRPTVSTKIFLSNYTIDDASPAHVDGVRLLPDTRYILFTKKATWNAPFKAEWYVIGACAVPSKPVMAGTSE